MQRSNSRRLRFESLEFRQLLSVTVLGDYSLDGYVDSADYVLWRSTKDTTVSTPSSGADGSGNGQIDQADYAVIRANFGNSVPAGQIPKIRGDYNLDNKVDATDLDVWNSTLGNVVLPHFSGADGNGNGRIDRGDYDVVQANLGQSLPSVTPPKLSGDYNADGTVDQSDYLVWRKSEGSLFVSPYSGADGNGDTKVDQADGEVVRASFGQTLPAEPVPNPPVTNDFHEEPIPDFAVSPTIISVASGNWSDPASWNTGRAPSATDVAVIPKDIQLTISDTAAIADRIVVHGTLQFATNSDTRLRVSTLHIEDDGALLVGTEQAPVTANAQIIIRDTPIDLNLDPQQYGTGLLVEGKIRIFGLEKTSFERLKNEPVAGATQLVFAAPVHGWQAGDRLFLPDTRQLIIGGPNENSGDKYVAESETVEVAKVSAGGTIVTLTTALQYNHFGARDGDGVLSILPHAANMSRNVAISSENSDGTRGHTMYIGRADVDIRFAEFDNLGRTTADPLDSTTFDAGNNVSHIGTNQIGRYSIHIHHLDGPEVTPANGYQFTLVGLVSNGYDEVEEDEATPHNFKWGLAVHASSYGLIQDNIIEGWAGAGLVLEDSTEAYNTIDHNFVARIWGTQYVREDNDSEMVMGAGIWLRNVTNYVRNNVVANVFNTGRSAGFVLTNFVSPNGLSVPVSPGSHDRKLIDGYYVPISEFAGNETYGTCMHGLSVWHVGSWGDVFFVGDGNPPSWITDFTAWNYSYIGVFNYPTEHLCFDGLTLFGDYNQLQTGDSVGQIGYLAGDYSAPGTVISHANIQNNHFGIMPTTFTSGQPFTVQDSYLRNITNIVFSSLYYNSYLGNLAPRETYINNVIFATPNVPALGRTFSNIAMSYNGLHANLIQRDEIYVTDYNGVTGDDFRVYYDDQRANFIVPQTIDGFTLIASPVAGLTNQQNWDLYGIAVAGSVAPKDAGLRNGIIGLVEPSS